MTVDVYYLEYNSQGGASGLVRMKLEDIPNWLALSPGRMITRIKILD